MTEYMLFSLFPGWNHVHPVLVHFTTALLPASMMSDVLGKFSSRYYLTPAAWWMLFYAAVATPATALAGWAWAGEFTAVAGMSPDRTLATHQWLGIVLAVCFAALAVWRGRTFMLRRTPGIAYLVTVGITTGVLFYQGYLGGKMTMG